MSKASGVITDVKSFDGQYGPMFNITVNNVRYGTGKEAGGKVGDFIEFDVEQKGKYFNAKNIVNKGQKPPEVSAPARATSAQNDMSKADWAHKDKTIAFQAARNASIALIGHLLQKDLLPLGKDPKKHVDIVQATSDILTQRFFDSSQNLGKAPPKSEDQLAAEAFDDSPDEITF